MDNLNRSSSRITLSSNRVFKLVSTANVYQILGSNVLLCAATYACKAWSLDQGATVFWILVRILGLSGLGACVYVATHHRSLRKRSFEYSALGTMSVLQFVQVACFITALGRLPTLRVLVFSRAASHWPRLLSGTTSTLQLVISMIAVSVAVLTETTSVRHFAPGYASLALYGLACAAHEHTSRTLTPNFGSSNALAVSSLGTVVFCLPLYLFRLSMQSSATITDIPWTAYLALPFAALSLLYLSPAVSEKAAISHSSGAFALSFSSLTIIAALFTIISKAHKIPVVDLVIAFLLIYGLNPQESQTVAHKPKRATTRLLQSYLKTILSNSESRKIFYFLMLNLSYMLVQMLYGIWTNSLGLISDAIHMAFDCMAIGMGLFASLMATWSPNEQFTYGYSRVETLSGFSNGIFLLLISVFIVFEAIQRIIDPPEMNTSQLLLVSSLGLGVNLFGMFAMGGHHHHGHSHSHGPQESHSHSATHSSGHHHDHASHGHSHDNGHSHDSHPGHHSHGATSEEHHHSHSPTLEKSPTSPSHHDHSRHSSPEHSPTHERLRELQLEVPTADGSPITPTYKFGHDPHFESHHHEHHTPNSHDHSHSHERNAEGHSHNMRGVFLHVMADTLGSVGVIISTLLIEFYGWTGFDPIASLFIATLIAASVLPLVIDAGKVLALDVGHRDTDIRKALEKLNSIEGLGSYRSPRFWPKDSDSLIGSIHIQLAPSQSSFDPTLPQSTRTATYSRLDHVLAEVDSVLRSGIPGLEELTIQTETLDWDT
ncbi:cation efflux protein [Sistotremastrum suecicum HHB10207 ss-3]|uniref:Cation efflux protein n=1 Tax=Sistotremastrum suecicum HHB10207 ss-3 TaxID=1314776 RepID=A0A166HXE7_9AGAM|nr:cation efflux protein [Sistotremastrum suecicum HHB10207 ss-3]